MPASRMSRRAAVSVVVPAGAAVAAGLYLLLTPVRASITPIIGNETYTGEIACGNAFTTPPLTRLGSMPASFRHMVDRLCMQAKTPPRIAGGTLTGAGTLGLAITTTLTIGRRDARSGT